jgi:RIO kinase 1
MRTPDTLLSLVDYGIIDEVVRPLMSGKEAQIYLVLSGGEQRVAKIYKEAQNRSFQNRADYTEGRRVRNSRDQRAMGTRSRHGRAQSEAAWKSAEVDMIYRLRDAGVRVPTPFHFIDGVLLMELVTDADGFPAPRLGDLEFEPAEAEAVFQQLIGEVVRMLCAGVVHGDLSDFNVLMGTSGPVIIDFPQAVDASSNQNARKLLLRDVDNLLRFRSKFAPEQTARAYAEEMWDLYQRSALTPDTRLTGTFRSVEKKVKTDSVLGLISDAERDERRRRERLGLSMRGVDAPPAARPRDARPQAQHTRDAQPRDARPGDARPRDAHPQAQHTRDAHPRDAQHTRDAHPRDAQHTRDARPRDAHPRDARPRDAQHTRDARPRDAHPRDARPHEQPTRAEHRARPEQRATEGTKPRSAEAPRAPRSDSRAPRSEAPARSTRDPRSADGARPMDAGGNPGPRLGEGWKRYARRSADGASPQESTPRDPRRPR